MACLMASILQTAGLITPSKCQTEPCLTVVLWKYQVFWEIQSAVSTYGVMGVRECFNPLKGRGINWLHLAIII